MPATNPELSAKGIEATSRTSSLKPVAFERHAPGPKDVVMAIKYCGVCHSDVHAVRDDVNPGNGKYPVMPGHEIAGIVEWVGSEVTKFRVGDRVGVGCMVDSCLSCEYCEISEEQYCDKGCTLTYGSQPKSDRCGSGVTRGGYSTRMTVQERFAVKLPEELPMEVVGPVLCAGITTYDPLKHWGAGSEHCKRIGIIGGGGLGHMGIQLAKAMGCEVTAITTSPSKIDALKKLGASRVVVSTDEDQMKAAQRSLDLILNTISAPHDAMHYVKLLRPNGTLVQLGLVGEAHTVTQLPLVNSRTAISGSLIGGMRATQELVDLCAREKIWPSVEVIPCSKVNEAFDELQKKSSLPRRYVLDIANTMDDFYVSQRD